MASGRQKNTSDSSEEVYIGRAQSIPSTSPEQPSEIRTSIKRHRGKNILFPTRSSEFDLTQEDLRIHGPLNLQLPVHYAGDVQEPLQRAWTAGLDRKVTAILAENQIHTNAVTLEKLWSAYSSWTSSRAKGDFIKIEVSNDSASTRWVDAAEDILRYCKFNNIKDVNVQIATRYGLMQRTTTTINPKHPAVEKWTEMCPFILNIIKTRKTWKTIDLVSRGKAKLNGVERSSDDEYRPTILVTLGRESGSENWQTASEALETLLQNRGLAGMALEFYRDEVGFQVSPPSRFRVLSHHPNLLQDKAYMGASIQGQMPAGSERGSGTLGCFLSLTIDGQKKALGLTNFHVVMSPYNMNTENPLKDQSPQVQGWIGNGFRPADSDPSKMRINMPSRVDTELAIAQRNEDLVDIMEKDGRRSVYEMVKDSLISCSLEDARKGFGAKNMAMYEDFRGMLGRTQKVLSEAENRKTNDKLGHVFAASGLRIAKDSMMLDWALIDVLPERTPATNVADLGSRGLVRMYDFGEPVPDEVVHKVGRTTGMRSGWVNAVKSIQLKGVERNQTKNQWRCVTAEAQLVLPEKYHELENESAIDQREPYAFSWGGDSGSAIYSSTGVFRGLLFGAAGGNERSYFTPVGHLFEDIKHITGATKVEMLWEG